MSPAPLSGEEARAAFAAALLFCVTPSDRALKGWYAPGEAFSQLQDLGVELVREAG